MCMTQYHHTRDSVSFNQVVSDRVSSGVRTSDWFLSHNSYIYCFVYFPLVAFLFSVWSPRVVQVVKIDPTKGQNSRPRTCSFLSVWSRRVLLRAYYTISLYVDMLSKGGGVTQHGENQLGSFLSLFKHFWFFRFVEFGGASPPPPHATWGGAQFFFFFFCGCK